MAVGDMLKIAIAYDGRTAKDIARECNYSDDAFYLATKNERPLPTQARPKIAQLNIIGMMTVALEATGFCKLYEYLRVDRHIYSLIQRVIKEDREADQSLHHLRDLLLDKPTREDLAPEDRQYIEKAGREIFERMNVEMNLLAELERQYGIDFLSHLTQKEKAAPVRAVK